MLKLREVVVGLSFCSCLSCLASYGESSDKHGILGSNTIRRTASEIPVSSPGHLIHADWYLEAKSTSSVVGLRDDADRILKALPPLADMDILELEKSATQATFDLNAAEEDWKKTDDDSVRESLRIKAEKALKQREEAIEKITALYVTAAGKNFSVKVTPKEETFRHSALPDRTRAMTGKLIRLERGNDKLALWVGEKGDFTLSGNHILLNKIDFGVMLKGTMKDADYRLALVQGDSSIDAGTESACRVVSLRHPARGLP